jgi:propionyl-CoA carboxylase beta chain
MEYAMKVGCPLIGFNDSGGARIQEGDDSLSGYGQVFFRNVLVSGVVPQIAVVAGPCAGGAAYSPALMDFIIMVKGSSNMFICGPEVIQAVTGQKCTMDEIGSPMANASVSGNVHFIAENDTHAIQIARKILTFVPSNNLSDPPHRPTPQVDMARDLEMNKLVPESSKDPLDVFKVIARLVDDADFLEVHQAWARNIIVGFGRIQGISVGIIANNPLVKAGTLDIDSSDKAARFIRFCNVFNIPIVTLVDVPGFMPGVQQERGGIIRHGAKMLFAYAAATVPKITVILRKAYGGAYLAMCSADLRKTLETAQKESSQLAATGLNPGRFLIRKQRPAADAHRNIGEAPGPLSVAGSQCAFGFVHRVCNGLNIDPCVRREAEFNRSLTNVDSGSITQPGFPKCSTDLAEYRAECCLDFIWLSVRPYCGYEFIPADHSVMVDRKKDKCQTTLPACKLTLIKQNVAIFNGHAAR